MSKCAEYPLEVAIWENESEGRRYYSVSVSRTYTVTDEDTGEKEYKRTSQLRKQDLLLTAMLMQDAFKTVSRLEAQDYEARRSQ